VDSGYSEHRIGVIPDSAPHTLPRSKTRWQSVIARKSADRLPSPKIAFQHVLSDDIPRRSRTLATNTERWRTTGTKSDRWPRSKHLFTTTDRRPIPPPILGKQWRDLRERVDLGKLLPEHTCVSLLLALGSAAAHRARDRRPFRHQGHDDRLRPRQSRRAHGGACPAWRCYRGDVAVNGCRQGEHEEEQDHGNVG
jgi:hypothetical protein